MPKISLAGFRDPVRRPRYIIWCAVLLLVFIPITVVTLGVTSTRWFCSNGCHKVQDDTILAYQRSSHSEVSCLACHMPVNADSVTFMLHKMEALAELYLTVTDKYELPLNAESEVAEHMEAEQCTQCHSKNRKITPSSGIIIDHEIHAKNKVKCTMCHNRIAHREDFKMKLKAPDGKPNHPHENFMKMEACFRCHGLEKDAKAPGRCAACHPSDFKLKPETHLQAGFFPKGHAKMAKEEPEYCVMCHERSKFCDKCHGMPIPHPANFKTPASGNDAEGHPAVSKTLIKKCESCHHQSTTKFCDQCHHKPGFVMEVPWRTQHGKSAVKAGTTGCLEKCHKVDFCSGCHGKLKPFPASHKQSDWVHRRSPGATAKHSGGAKAQILDCEVCHGKGGPANTPFCRDCHKVEMPHTEQFKKFHASTGRKNPAVCANCHRFRELCSNCHHDGASNSTPWIQMHPGIVGSSGADGCLQKCHQKNDCVACHQKTRAFPTSHKRATWTKRATLRTKAQHPLEYKKQAENCTYCHGEGGPKAQFCISCHKIEMPHLPTFAPGKNDPAQGKKEPASHGSQFRAKKLSKAVCANCHIQTFCDRCHHEGASLRTAWVDLGPGASQHPGVVNKNGADKCFKCHQPTYCSFCHVRQIH